MPTSTTNETLIQQIISLGYTYTVYPEQDIISYSKTLPILDFIAQYGQFKNFVGESNTSIQNLLGDSVVIEYVPSTNVAQWCTCAREPEFSNPDFMDFETFSFDTEEDRAMTLLRLFASA